jgi:outer membrane receptor protein involved in Fe transport
VRRVILLALAWSVLGASTGGSIAQADEPETATPATAATVDSVTTEEVLVSATRTPEPAHRIPASASVLTRERIERSPFPDGHQVDDLLRYVPGVQSSNLSSRYNHPTAQAITLRGLGSRRALVLLDGVPLNDGFGGWINWGLVPNNLDRIEVVPGGGSNLYGTWAMGGVVHLITQPPMAGPGFRAESQAGNLNSYQQTVSARYGTQRAALSLHYRWFHTNGFIPTPADQRGPIDQLNDSRHEHFTGAVSVALDSRTTLTLAGSLFREDRSFGTPLSLAARTIGNAALGLEGETSHGDRWETKLFAQWQTFRNLTSQITPAPTVRLSEARDRIQTIPSNDFGGSVQWTAPLALRHRLMFGGDARAIIAQSEDQVFTATGPAGRALAKGQQVGWGVFGEWIADLTDWLTVIPSFRSDWWKNFDARIESTQGAVTIPRDNVEHVLNPKLAVHYRLTDRLRTGAAVYQAFRAPTLNELYRGFGFSGFNFLPNENLTPERLPGGEVKLEGDFLPNRRLSWRISGHYDEVKGQIIFVTQSPLAAQRQNVGRTRTYGGELDVVFRPVDGVSLNLGYALRRLRDQGFSRQPLARRQAGTKRIAASGGDGPHGGSSRLYPGDAAGPVSLPPICGRSQHPTDRRLHRPGRLAPETDPDGHDAFSQRREPGGSAVHRHADRPGQNPRRAALGDGGIEDGVLKYARPVHQTIRLVAPTYPSRGLFWVADLGDFFFPEDRRFVGVVFELEKVAGRVFQKERPVLDPRPRIAHARLLVELQTPAFGPIRQRPPGLLVGKHQPEVPWVNSLLVGRRLFDEMGHELMPGQAERHGRFRCSPLLAAKPVHVELLRGLKIGDRKSEMEENFRHLLIRRSL